MPLGEKIATIRKSKGVSQELLAERSNISLRTIQRIESGASAPRPYTVKTLADALNVPVEELSDLNEGRTNEEQEAIATLRLVNFSAMAGVVVPFTNVLLPALIWRRNTRLTMVNELGPKIIAFQLMWTLGTFLLVFLVPFVQHQIFGSYVIGRFPPTVFIVYAALIILNVLFTMRTARQLKNRQFDIYSFVPTLF